MEPKSIIYTGLIRATPFKKSSESGTAFSCFKTDTGQKVYVRSFHCRLANILVIKSHLGFVKPS